MAAREDLPSLLARQEGVVSRTQLARLRLDDGYADRRVASRRWCRLLPQVYLAGPGPATSLQLARAGLLHGGPSAAVTGRVACRTWQLRDVPDGGDVALLLPHDVRRTGGPGLRVVRTRLATPRADVGGLVVVQPARALADAARDGMPLREVRAVVLAAIADRRVALSDVEALAEAGPRRDGAHLRRTLQDARRGAASAPEAEAVDLVLPLARRRGLVLLVNPVLRVGGVLLGSPDLYLPALALGLELDSRRHHAGVDDLDATFRRHRCFADAGDRLLHATPSRVRAEPRAVLRELVAEVEKPWPVPAGLRVEPFAGRWGVPLTTPLAG